MIALSYRREDSLAVAGRLYDRLQARFGKHNVFMDFDSIRPGFDFRDQITSTIERCDIVVAIIGPHWLGQQSDSSRRIDDTGDFVRLEIACALKRKIPIIPVLINDTEMPQAGTLPADIQALAYRHALPLDSGLDFHQHADRLIMGISTVVEAAAPTKEQTGENKPPSAPTPAPARSRQKILIGAAVALTIAVAWAAWLGLRPQERSQQTTKRPNDMETSGLPPAEPRLAPATAISPAVIVPDSARASPPKETTLNPPEQPVKAWLEFSSEPNGAKVFRNGELIGTTPLRSAEFLAGDATFLFVREGYLPRELKAAIDPAKGFKDSVSLVQPAPVYTGEIRVLNEGSASSRPIEIKLNSDLRSGTMTQSSKRGDFVVKFTGVWDGTILHSVTSDVISQPHGIQWAPESFILRFGDDGKSASYQCVAEGKTYGADLSAQSPSAVRAASVYKGTIRREGDERGAGVPLTITLASDRKSGTQTQSSKSGDTIVKFNGVWDGRTLRAVTDEVVSKPKNIQWKPESFTLKFANDWATAVYECNAEGQLFTAKLSVP